MGLKEQLNRRDFRRLIIGQTVSSFGDWMGTLALMYFVLELSGSTTAVGGVLVLRLLPSALGAPVAARVVTRWRRRSVMLWSDLIRTGMALALPVVPWLVWVYFWAFLIEVVGLVFLPARDAAVPFLIEDDEEEHDTGTLEIANGITMATSYGMIPVGAGAFGLLLWLSNSAGWEGNWRYVLVFWLNAATYLVSYVAIRSIPDLGPGPRERRETAREAPHAGFLAALRLPVVRGVLPGVAVVALGLGALFSLGVVFVRNVLGAGAVGFGALVVLFGVGAIAGLLLIHRKAGNLMTQVRAGTAAQGIVIALMGGPRVAGVVVRRGGGVRCRGDERPGRRDHVLPGGARRGGAEPGAHGVPRRAAVRAGAGGAAGGGAADLLRQAGASPLGMAPGQFVLAASGLIVLLGTFLIRTPDAARVSPT
ncbi:MFS transporter [Actinomadura madurae]|uniref:MFS transporter n=1 Tax=Actinomadura madurae TaxID=1993 RepID=UPI002025E0A6|nr:MFS transporter [Actinomadura madurae]URN10051.1 MFS transporter [Actinomadura madurae]